MKDVYRREIEYLRISVTDRCNLRCVYCMPSEKIEWYDQQKILSYDEIIELVEIFASLGIKYIKLTGGEPLVRNNLATLVKAIKSVAGIEAVTLTTNGVLLADQLDGLVEAGLDAVNISIDSLDNQTFEKITRFDYGDAVKEAIKECCKYPYLRVKVNCVPIKGVNEQGFLDIVSLAKDYPVSVRFIEMMPVGMGQNFEAFKEEELRPILEQSIGLLVPYTKKLGNGPCHYFEAQGFKGKIGFISAISHQFCHLCNRIRLSSTGYLKSCLQYDTGVDLRTLLRSETSKEMLREQMFKGIYNKPKAHSFGKAIGQGKEDRKMFEIGG